MKKTHYDPTHPIFREMLGLHLLGILEEAGFCEAEHLSGERIFFRKMPDSDRKSILVYTSIPKRSNSVRAAAADAIRVCGVYEAKGGETRGLVSKKRVHRTGFMEDIGDRMLVRMRETWSAMQSCDVCRDCGSPMFTSKAGNSVCAEVCWTDGKSKDWKNRYSNVKRNKYRRKK